MRVNERKDLALRRLLGAITNAKQELADRIRQLDEKLHIRHVAWLCFGLQHQRSPVFWWCRREQGRCLSVFCGYEAPCIDFDLGRSEGKIVRKAGEVGGGANIRFSGDALETLVCRYVISKLA